MTYLLDVNVLIALLDPAHLDHHRTHDWFAREGAASFATCPLTQNGVLRILGNPRYPGSPGTPAAVAPMLQSVTQLPGHAFWPDDLSLLDRGLVDPARLASHSRLTDDYLLALAASHRARLATLDRRLKSDAVRGGIGALALIA